MEYKNDLKSHYIIKNNKKLRFGYTTGTCAAAAAKAAAKMLFGEEEVSRISLITPKGIALHLQIKDISKGAGWVSCAVKKDAGDDPDVTDGLCIYAKVEKYPCSGILIEGGEGVGRITKKGLEQPVGGAAINHVPRTMIQAEVESVYHETGYQGGLLVTISVPKGEEIAVRTFNPRLGITGGISILGTSGIVEPMSEAALVKSIEIEMRMRVAEGNKYLSATPGNYGEAYLKEHMNIPYEENIKCGNHVGETIDMAVNLGAKGILFTSHIGKLIKVAGGIMNTHSRWADARAEIMCGNAIRAGANIDVADAILKTATTDEALEILVGSHLLDSTMEEIMSKLQYYLDYRACGRLMTGAIVFSNKFGYLGQTKGAEALVKKLDATIKQEG